MLLKLAPLIATLFPSMVTLVEKSLGDRALFPMFGSGTGTNGAGVDPWIAARTRYEAGLRPLLMITRAGARVRLGANHASR